jgi:hypothetical protein
MSWFRIHKFIRRFILSRVIEDACGIPFVA